MIKAGFSNILELESTLYGGGVPRYNSICGSSDVYYYMNPWRRLIDKYSGRLPLFTVASRSLAWLDMRQILWVKMPVIYEVDGMTGLPIFMLAAVGPKSVIEWFYNLLREYLPTMFRLISNSHRNTSTGTPVISGYC